MTEHTDGQHPNRYATGIFLELCNQEGALATPLWVSLRDKPVLTKQITQASVFESAAAALHYLSGMDFSGMLGEGSHITISARTYDYQAHRKFWDRMQEGAKEEKQQDDYSLHMIRVRQLIEQLDQALLNGPEELARTLPRELSNAFLDLFVAVDRHLN